ncbi:tetratricopeptide repeat protein [Candidatus Micrarchaeota archaeon]|nr:tetratricopeptide repeat protein [Candidatus Micrarchaeota archaeon]
MKRRQSDRGIGERPFRAIIAAAALTACTPPLYIPQQAEAPARKQEQSAQEAKKPEPAAVEKPTAMPEKAAEVAEKYKHEESVLEKITMIHYELNQYNSETGVKVEDMEGKPPRTAKEAMEKGGDCTDLAGIVVPILQKMEIPGGVLIVRFEGAPENTLHMVPYANFENNEIIIDLQARYLGDTANGKYEVVYRLDYEQAEYIYFAEYGDYYKQKNEYSKAIQYYENALKIFDGDAYVHYNIAVLYEKSDKTEKASGHYKKAAEIDPKYKKQEARGSYNEELRKAYAAYESGNWEECATHFRNALQIAEESGKKWKKGDKELLSESIQVCENNHKKTN